MLRKVFIFMQLSCQYQVIGRKREREREIFVESQ